MRKTGMLRPYHFALLACIALHSLSGCARSPSPHTPSPFPPSLGPSTMPFTPLPPVVSGSEPEIDAYLFRMTLEQKVGQIMIVGFDGPALTTELREMVTRYHLGGVILFAINGNIQSPEQVARLAGDLQTTALENGDPGLFLAIDQEGGRVARLTEDKGFTEFPGAMALSAAGNSGRAIGFTGAPAEAAAATSNPQVAAATQVAAAIAAEMRAVGLNVDFAPDLDVNNNPDNPIIGVRSFGSDPQRVAELGVAFLQGLQNAGVLAFGKHFPGHGDTAVDSHLALPVVPHARPRLEAVEFVPFKAAIQAGVAGIMSAHVTFPAIDPTPKLAATLSPKVLQGLLRDEWGYEGLLVTDSLEMGALAQSGFPVPVAAPTALQAGADLLLFNRNHSLHQQAYTRVLEAVRSGQIPASRLDEAVRRVLRAKAKLGLLNPGTLRTALPDPAAAASLVGTPEHRRLAHQVAAQAITLVRDDAALLPLGNRAEPGAAPTPLLVVEVPGAGGLGAALNATTLRVGETPTRAETNLALGAARDGRLVILTTIDARRNPAQAALVQAFLDAGDPTIVVALRGPYDLLAFPAAPTYLATYGYNPPTLDALVAILTGQAQPAGRLPVELPGLYPLGAGLQGFAKK